MIRSTPVGVKGAARPAPESPRQIQFAFRADPVALDDLKLPARSRAAFVLILDNARSRAGVCRLSNATIGRILGCCTMTVKRALARLEAAHLIRRETTAEGRIRTGIVVTWEGVEHPRSTERMGVEHPCAGGGTPTFRGVEHPRSTNQTSTQSENQTGPILSTGEGEDSEEAALFATLGPAKYLQAMIAKGKAEAAARSGGKPLPCPPPPAPVEAPKPPIVASPGKAPGVPQDDASREVGRMVRDLGQALKSETVGRWQGRQSADVQSRRLDAWRRGRIARHAPCMTPPVGPIGSPVMHGAWKPGSALNPTHSTADLNSHGGGSCTVHDARIPEGGKWKSSHS